ncbi:MAG TPA: twin-arginine translocase TatA/TatE family subunit [Thermoanaerobaculia bacterium]|nr:twin-arginine translocase TatA/TatE family subunit [Thermoanaerobaculia bacterium]
MFGPLGVPELIFILVLALLIFGPKRLPEIGRTLGKGMSEFRKASNDLKRTINTELALEETPAPPSSPSSSVSPGTTRRLPAMEAMDQPPAEPEPPAFRMPDGPPAEVEARSPARPLPPEWTEPPEPQSAANASTAEPLEPR